MKTNQLFWIAIITKWIQRKFTALVHKNSVAADGNDDENYVYVMYNSEREDNE